MAPRQAESEVLGGSKEGAKIVDGKFGYFYIEEVDSVMKTSLSVITGPEPDASISVAVKEAGKQSLSPHPGSATGVPILGGVREVVCAR